MILNDVSIFQIIFGIMFFSLGLLLIIRFVIHGQRFKSSKSWHSIQGEVIRSELINWTAMKGRNRKTQHGYHILDPLIVYKYYAPTGVYTSSKICISEKRSDSHLEKAVDRWRKYQVGAKVDVYYDPKNPENACLERTLESPVFISSVGPVLCILGIFILAGIIPF